MSGHGPLIALIIFAILAVFFGFWAVLAYNDYTEAMEKYEGETGTLNEDRRTIAGIEKRMKDNQAVVADLLDKARLEETRFAYLDHKARNLRVSYDYLRKVGGLKTEGGSVAQTYLAAAEDVRQKLTAAREKAREQIGESKRALKTEADKRVAETQAEINAVTERIGAEKGRLDKEEQDVKSRAESLKKMREEYKRQLEMISGRDLERARYTDEVDGKVVFADPVQRTVVINRGTADGIRNGYRFEVYRRGLEGRKKSLGYIEVKSAEADAATCFIVVRPLKLPRDPQSTYVASEPEELYSPYSEASGKDVHIQRLNGQPKAVVEGDQTKKPIVAGDLIQNPFVRPGRALTFYIAGSKDVVDGVYKSAIAYPWPRIKSVAEFYGCKVVDKVSLQVDCVIAQKNPTDDPQFAEAVNLGIPVLYEWELFRFLDTD